MRLLLAYIHNRSGFDVDSGWRSWKEISAETSYPV
jgi:hypothetical protein